MVKKHIYLIALTLILFLNIIFAKYIVHQYFYQNYGNTLIFVGLNLALFPLAILMYKKDKEKQEVNKYE